MLPYPISDARDPFDPTSLRERLVTYLQGQTGAEAEIGPVTRHAAGFSWLTYGFEAAWRDEAGAQRRRLILRLGPPRGLFAPYSAWPQFAALTALASSPVPVPRAYWWSDDPAHFGAPFLICEEVGGDTPLPWVRGEAFPDGIRETLAEQFVAALAALHRFDWRGTPLATLGGAVDAADASRVQIVAWERAVRRWALRPYPVVEWALGWLRGRGPTAPRVSVVHGDYRIGNFLVRDGRITAILDWELVHVGDPHEDLGWMCLRAFRGRSPLMCHLIARHDLYRRYEALSGIVVSPHSVHFYEVFGTFKLLAIHLGAARCFEDGRFDDLRLAAMGAQIPRLLSQLEEVIEATP